MLGQWQAKGGLRLDPNGNFEVYLNSGSGSKSPCTDESWKQYLRELFDFLMSRSSEPRQIGERMVYKSRSSNGNLMVSMSIVGLTIKLIRGQGEFATFILELPFMGEVQVQEDLVGASAPTEDEEFLDAP